MRKLRRRAYAKAVGMKYVNDGYGGWDLIVSPMFSIGYDYPISDDHFLNIVKRQKRIERQINNSKGGN